MADYTVSYKYPRGTMVYIKESALKGQLLGGPVGFIKITIGNPGLGDRVVKEYLVTNPIIFAPPSGFFDELELCDLEEAKSIIREWADRQVSRFEGIRDQEN